MALENLCECILADIDAKSNEDPSLKRAREKVKVREIPVVDLEEHPLTIPYPDFHTGVKIKIVVSDRQKR